MMKKLLSVYKSALTCNLKPMNFSWQLVHLSYLQYCMNTAVRATGVPKGLEQYYADLLMLELVETGRL